MTRVHAIYHDKRVYKDCDNNAYMGFSLLRQVGRISLSKDLWFHRAIRVQRLHHSS